MWFQAAWYEASCWGRRPDVQGTGRWGGINDNDNGRARDGDDGIAASMVHVSSSHVYGLRVFTRRKRAMRKKVEGGKYILCVEEG